jgi:uncharacterized membrane protein
MSPIEPRLQGRIDAYLMRLRTSLGDLPTEEASEIVREIRGHLVERVQEMDPVNDEVLTQFLRGFGSPEDIASLYETRAMVARARVSASPVLILRATIRWAARSMIGFLACSIALFGYAFGVGTLICAFLKPFHPDRVGLWVGRRGWDLSMGAISAAEQTRDQARELLGWWLIPFALIVGPLMLILTTMILRWMLRFAFRRTPIRRAQFDPSSI